MLAVALVIGLVLVAFAAMTLVRALTLPSQGGSSSETVEQIGAYGFSSTAVVADGDAAPQRSLGDVAAGIAGTFTNRNREARETEIRRRLIAAGLYSTSPRTIVGYQLMASIGMFVLWALAALISGTAPVILVLGLFVAPMFGWILPSFILGRKAAQRLHEVDKALPEMIDLLVVTVEAGVGFVASLRLAAQQLEGPLAQELRLTLQEQSMGLSSAEALLGMAKRVDTAGVRSFSRAIVQGETLGVSIGQILRNLAGEMRKKRRAMAEEKAQKAPIKMLFPLIFLIFPAIFVVLLLPAIISIANTLGG
jgi:tight adherence protein C